MKNKLAFYPVVCCRFTWNADSTGCNFLCYGILQYNAVFVSLMSSSQKIFKHFPSHTCTQKYIKKFMFINNRAVGQIQKIRSVLKFPQFSKLSLLLIFGPSEAEIIEVKDTRTHFQFSHIYARFFPFLAVRITLLDFQNTIWNLAILSVIFSTQMTKLLTKIILNKPIWLIKSRWNIIAEVYWLKIKTFIHNIVYSL